MNKVAIIFVGGLVAGLVAGILFAPESGEETREKILRKTRDTFDTLLQKVEEGMDLVRHMKSDVGKQMPDVTDVLTD